MKITSSVKKIQMGDRVSLDDKNPRSDTSRFRIHTRERVTVKECGVSLGGGWLKSRGHEVARSPMGLSQMYDQLTCMSAGRVSVECIITMYNHHVKPPCNYLYTHVCL